MVAQILPKLVAVTVGPPGQVGRVWDQRLYIKGEIERTSAGTPNKAKIDIYNLSPASLAWLKKPGHVMSVALGRPVMSTLFYGEVKPGEVMTEVKHPNQVTTIKAQDGQRAMQMAYFAASYPAGTTRTQILNDALSSSAIATGYVYPLPERVYQAAVAFAGPLPDVFDELYIGEPASWSLQSGRFSLTHDDIPNPGNALIVSAQTGMIGSPKPKDKGIEVKTSHLGAVQPGGPIVVQSRLVNGTYKVTKATAAFDTETEWEDRLTATVVK